MVGSPKAFWALWDFAASQAEELQKRKVPRREIRTIKTNQIPKHGEATPRSSVKTAETPSVSSHVVTEGPRGFLPLSSNSTAPRRGPNLFKFNRVPRRGPHLFKFNRVPRRGPNLPKFHRVPRRGPNLFKINRAPRRGPNLPKFNRVPRRGPRPSLQIQPRATSGPTSDPRPTQVRCAWFFLLREFAAERAAAEQAAAAGGSGAAQPALGVGAVVGQ